MQHRAGTNTGGEHTRRELVLSLDFFSRRVGLRDGREAPTLKCLIDERSPVSRPPSWHVRRAGVGAATLALKAASTKADPRQQQDRFLKSLQGGASPSSSGRWSGDALLLSIGAANNRESEEWARWPLRFGPLGVLLGRDIPPAATLSLSLSLLTIPLHTCRR
jgi:hypothetical protein